MYPNKQLEEKLLSLTKSNFNDTASALTAEEVEQIKSFLWDFFYIEGSADKTELLKQYAIYRLIYNIQYYEKSKTDELYKIWESLI